MITRARDAGDRILLLVDMNGTVCYRSKLSVSGAMHDLYVRSKHFYKRPGVEKFLRALMASGQFDIAVYSSMMRHNIEAGMNAIFPKYKEVVFRVLDRDMNKPDPNGADEWDTIRDMNKVWRALPGYNARNTILLDNEARKFGDTPRNGIVVPEFGVDEVRARTAGTLDPLLEYLLDLADDLSEQARDKRDVRRYLEQHPFGEAAAAATSSAEPESKGDDVSGRHNLDGLMSSLSLGGRGSKKAERK